MTRWRTRVVRVIALLGLIVLDVQVGAILAEEAPCRVAKIIGSTGNETAQYGWSIDIVGDVLVVGSPFNDDVVNQGGQAAVFRRTEGVWQEESLLAPQTLRVGDNFGFSVAVDRVSNGDRVVVGAAATNCPFSLDCGTVFVFEHTDGTWMQESELLPDELNDEHFFGNSVAIEGGRIAIGAPQTAGRIGEAYVFEHDGLEWRKVARIVPSGSTGYFGQAVALQGEFLFVGASRDSQVGAGAGAVFVYRRDEFGAWNEIQKLTASGRGSTGAFGYSLAVSGNTLLCGAPFGDPGSGVAYVFEFDEAQERWIEARRLEPSVPGLFGKSVAIMGKVAAIGDNGFSGEPHGAAYLFETTTWSECARILPPQMDLPFEFGAPVVLSADSIVIGAYGDTNEHGDFAGAVYVHLRSGLLAGNTNTGDGSPPEDVLFVNGSSGNRCNVMSVQASVPSTVSVERSSMGNGAYAFWIYDFRKYAGAPIQYRKGGTIYDLGSGLKALPINNSVTPGSVPCPLTFPVGWTSQSLGAGVAGTFCLNSQPGFPRAPTSFNVIFPPGNFILGGLVTDQNSINSPALNVSIANWIFVRSR